MSIAPLPIGRVSEQMTSALLSGTLQSDQISLLNVQQQISTGKRLNQPSDDPAGTVGIMRLNQQIAGNTQYSTNLSFAAGFLGQADSTLGQVSTLVTQAQSIASSQVGTTSTADQRASQAAVVDSMLSELMNLANTKYQGQAVFGGQSGTQNPFVAAGGGYKYVGTSQGQGIMTPSGASLQYTVDGSQVFGGVSAQVMGYQNLTPALTASTRLADLGGAQLKGVATGPVSLTIGATTVTADLSHAASISDVTGILNSALTAAGSTATVSTSGGSLVVNGDATQSLTIADTNGGTTAADLGIAGTVAATATLTGGALSPRITATTPLSALNNGAGIDPSGIIVTNGANSATITLAGPPALNTVQDLLHAIQGSGTNVQAQINAAGTGIDVLNPVSGAALQIGENGGNTAQQLGIRSFNPATKLADLNGGTGITPISQTATGPTGTLLVTQTDGTQFSVKVSGVSTPSQLIAAINSATGNTGVTAALNPTGNGITLTDTSGGSGNVSVAAGSDFVSNGTNLGLFQAGTGGTLTGNDMTFSTDDFKITRKDGTWFTVNVTGATTVQDVLNKINGADGNSGPNAVVASLNSTGNGIHLSDPSTGSGVLTVSAVNASPAAGQLGLSKSAAAGTPGTISGDDVNAIQPQGLFSSLAQLRDALLHNDTQGIQQAATALAADGTRISTANGIVGAREQDIQTRQGNLTTEQNQLQQSLSLLQDTDMTSAITQYQMLSTSFQAALQVAAQNQNLSLLNFLK